jgi:arylsulfatase A-like enzyme
LASAPFQNVLLIVVDTLRPDHLGCYGYGRNTSPHLDRLAADGTLLESLWSASNFTAPAFTSLFTGLYPHHHGVFDFTAQARSSQLAAAVAEAGMQTAGVVAFRFFQNLLKNIWGEIEAVTDTRSFNYSKNLPFDVTDSAIAWLDGPRDRDRPFCLFVHYDGPHMPFRLPDEAAAVFTSPDAEQAEADVLEQLFPRADRLDDARNKTSMYKFMKDVNWGKRKLAPATLNRIIDLYDCAIRYNDAAIGKLLDHLESSGLAEDTAVVVISDHGEEFLEHGGFAHGGIHLYEEIVRTVGLIRVPGLSGSARKTDVPLSQVDLLPTIFKLAGMQTLPENAGSPQLGAFLGGREPATETPPVFCHGKSKIALRSGAHKLILPRPNPSLDRISRLKMWINMALQRKLGREVFDLGADAGEKNNLKGDRRLRRSLEAILEKHLKSAPPELLVSRDIAQQEKDRIEQEMRDLGYM